jgi:hypothetical protein
MNRERNHLLALSITDYYVCISNNNLIDLQGQNNNGVQPQFTMQPQVTSFNPYQQQAQQEAMQVRMLCIFCDDKQVRLHCRLSGPDNSKSG